MAVSALVEAEIFSTNEVEEIHSALARMAITLMGARLVVENLPEFLDARFPYVVGP